MELTLKCYFSSFLLCRNASLKSSKSKFTDHRWSNHHVLIWSYLAYITYQFCGQSGMWWDVTTNDRCSLSLHITILSNVTTTLWALALLPFWGHIVIVMRSMVGLISICSLWLSLCLSTTRTGQLHLKKKKRYKINPQYKIYIAFKSFANHSQSKFLAVKSLLLEHSFDLKKQKVNPQSGFNNGNCVHFSATATINKHTRK